MTAPTANEILAFKGRPVYDSAGDKIGKVEDMYVD